jgi:Type ISP C-terminal specificity domain/N-6 DNA Methylase
MAANFTSVMTGTPEQRVEALRQFLGYPLKQRDPEKNLFWYLRPGADEDTASETRPVAVGFYPELNEGSDSEIKAWAVSQESALSNHFSDWFDDINKPVMYLLLPEAQQSGRVALVLPSESQQWQRWQVRTYEWDSQSLRTPLGRLQQGELELMQKVEDKPMFSVPLVEWAFYKPIATAKELAQELARVSRDMEQIIAAYEEATLNDYLKTLYESFKRELLPNLKVSSDNAKDYSFADIYAQTIAYGLFTARVFSHVQNPREDFNRQDAWAKLPETNPFLRQLFQGISEQPAEDLGDDLADKISEVFSILRAAQMDAILSDFRQKMNREDIVIRFYEDFLAAYKPEMRERRGVYYTPEPVVSYMVRSVDILLKEKFDKPLGLADPEVRILDPACGTGTFLLYVFQEIRKKFLENPEALTEGLEDKSWSGYVKERLLPRVFGFELLMAPYAICHLKLGLFLEETGYQFDSGKRLGVYLTNTLDDLIKKAETLLEEFIAEEGDQAAEIKNKKKIMIVIGNPPYSRSSHNRSHWIESLLEDYKTSVREEESQIQGLSNDYIKFIRFAQWRVEQSLTGMFCFITGHGYLNGPQARDMRSSLLDNFSSIDILNLQGSIRRESSLDNLINDDPVFAIQQGTAITIAIKTSEENENIRYADINKLIDDGSIDNKLAFLYDNDSSTTSWESFTPTEPYFFFTSDAFTSAEIEEEYRSYFSITEIFGTGNRNIDKEKLWATGFASQQDEFAISFDVEELESKVRDLLDSESEDDLRKRYRTCKTNQWNYERAKGELVNGSWRNKISRCSYRPFDIRMTAFDRNILTILRSKITNCFLGKENVGLVCSRVVNDASFAHVFVSERPVDKIFLSSKTSTNAYVFPLYIYPDNSNDQGVILAQECTPNLSGRFLSRMNSAFGFTPSSECIFGYVYSILNSTSYRRRYEEVLKIDFPRIPLINDFDLFNLLSGYGQELVELHLMKTSKLDVFLPEFDSDYDCNVDPGYPKYKNGTIFINKQGAGFTGVSEEVWNFYVGGYQVCKKWLSERKGRTLSDDDILHYQKIIVALQETIRIMQQIDEAIPSWPIE